jgi:amino acid transporter
MAEPTLATATDETHRPYQHRLDSGSVGLSGVLMQSVAQISPTLGIFYTIAFTTGQAGVTAPLTYLLAFLVCLTLAVPIGGLARHLPSAGGFYTYVSDALGPRTGFLVGWLYGVSVSLVPAALAAFTGAVLHDELSAEFGIGLPWWVYAAAILALCFTVAFRGIVISARFMIFMGLFEIAVGLALALTGVFDPGPGGVSARGFNPANITSSSGFFLAVVLSIFAFTGFESAATIGEESRNPHRIIPRSIIGSVAAIGVFYVFTAWGLQVGWGVNTLDTLADSPTAPAFVLAQRLWHGGWIVVLIALVNSGIGVCIACTTSATRTLYGMSRTGALPAALGTVHQRFRTPHIAVTAQTLAATVVLVVIGASLGPYNLFNLFGVAGTFVYIIIFTLANVAAWRFFRTRKPEQFSWVSHVAFPIVSTAALAVIGYKSLVPLPAWPVWLGPLITVGYVASGAIMLALALRPARRAWMDRAGELPDVA